MASDKHDPMKELSKLRDLFHELFGSNVSEHFSDESSYQSRWTPPADVYQTPEEMVIQLEVPGVDKEDIQIEYNGAQLSIRGKRNVLYDDDQVSIQRLERPSGQFERLIDLTVPVDGTKISAEYLQGILHITLPVQRKAAKTIPIESES